MGPVYRVDSSDPTEWQEKVYRPAEVIVEDFINGRKPAAEPLERIDGGREREDDCRKTTHCDICDRDFKGSAQFRNHLKSSSHKKVVRAVEGFTRYEMVLTEVEEERRNEAAKLLKNTLVQPISEVFAKMKSIPSVAGTVIGKSKAENNAELVKLAGHHNKQTSKEPTRQEVRQPAEYSLASHQLLVRHGLGAEQGHGQGERGADGHAQAQRQQPPLLPARPPNSGTEPVIRPAPAVPVLDRVLDITAIRNQSKLG